MFEKTFYYLDKQARGDLNAAQTVLSAHIEVADEGDGSSWARTEMELRTEGVPIEYTRDNKQRIEEVLRSVVELHHLERVEEATVMAGDTVSQVGMLA